MKKSVESIMGQTSIAAGRGKQAGAYSENMDISVAADPIVQYMTKDQLEKAITKTRKKMGDAVKELDFIEAAHLRDELFGLEDRLKKT